MNGCSPCACSIKKKGLSVEFMPDRHLIEGRGVFFFSIGKEFYYRMQVEIGIGIGIEWRLDRSDRHYVFV